MDKKEWTSVGMKLLGLYLIITHGTAFFALSASMLINQINKNDVMWGRMLVWTGPVSSLMILLSAILLLKKTNVICDRIWKE